MDENYGQSPNSITAGRTRKRKNFPADSSPSGENSTMVERAMRSAEKMRGVSTKPEDEATPQPTTAKRTQFAKPPKPDTSAGGGKLGKVSPEEQRGQSISQALLKGAAMVPNSSFSGTLRGLLGGASVGLDIGTALDKYRRQKLDETAATAAMKMSPEASAGVDVNLQDAQYMWGKTSGKREGLQQRYARRRRELEGENYTQERNA
jgi:hypothetical protein